MDCLRGCGDERDVDFLIVEGCDELQGFCYYKPMEQKKFEELIA